MYSSVAKLIILFFAFFTIIGIAKCFAQNVNRIVVPAKKISASGGQGLRIDSKKNIYVLNHQKHNITVLDSTFEVLRTIGGYGQGPGEFNLPEDFDLDSRDNVFVIDRFNSRMQIFNQKGEYILDVPLEQTIGSITILPNDQVFVNHTLHNKLFSRIDLERKEFVSHGTLVDFPWLTAMIDEIASNSEEKNRFHKNYPKLLNQALIRSDPAGNIYLLFLSAPILRKYRSTGELIFATELATTDIDSVMRDARRSLRLNMAKNSYVVSVLSQDFFVSPQNGDIYIIFTPVPWIVVLDSKGDAIKKIELIEQGSNRSITPVGISYYGESQWLVCNAQGTFIFRVHN